MHEQADDSQQYVQEDYPEERKSSGSDDNEPVDENVEGQEGSSSEEEIDPNKHDMQIPLAMWYFNQCDPKKCSGMILKRHGLLQTIPLQQKFQGIVLTPKASKIVS